MAEQIEATAEEPASTVDTAGQAAAAEQVVRRFSLYGAGTGLIPLLVIDTAALLAIQVQMLRRLAAVYGVPFREDVVKASVGAFLATGSAEWVGWGGMSLVARSVPVVGPVLGAVTRPFFAGAFTYAIGKVFIQHFASGGTFLTFDPQKVQGYFREKFAEGRSRMRGRAAAAPAA